MEVAAYTFQPPMPSPSPFPFLFGDTGKTQIGLSSVHNLIATLMYEINKTYLGVSHLGGEEPLQKKWQPTPVFLPGKSHGEGWQARVHGVAKSRTQLNN